MKTFDNGHTDRHTFPASNPTSTKLRINLLFGSTLTSFLRVKEWKYQNFACVLNVDNLISFQNLKSDFPYLQWLSSYTGFSWTHFQQFLKFYRQRFWAYFRPFSRPFLGMKVSKYQKTNKCPKQQIYSSIVMFNQIIHTYKGC